MAELLGSPQGAWVVVLVCFVFLVFFSCKHMSLKIPPPHCPFKKLRVVHMAIMVTALP